MKVNRYVLEELSSSDRQRLLRRMQEGIEEIEPKARAIVEHVRQNGDSALIETTRQFDQVELTAEQLPVSSAEFLRAEEQITPRLRTVLERAIANIRSHHRAQFPTGGWLKESSPGVISGERIVPIPSVGLYVPRGKGSFPSVMMMLCVPASLAGVRNIVVCTPPSPDGSMDAASLVAARMCGITQVFRIGGAQAIGAMAYGTETVPRVQKIIGPGNPWVTAAKRSVYGVVDPGPPAGPSEAIVLCDDQADPEIAARELLVEAEHGPDSAALLVTDSVRLADKVEKLLDGLVQNLPEQRRRFCETVLRRFGGMVITSGLTDSVEFVNTYAPEHLRLLVDEPFAVLPRIDHAGEVLLGENTSISFGNFSIGLNAILPTGGTARYQSCVGVYDFLKRSSFAYVSSEGLASVGDIALELAQYEGFPSHAEAAAFLLSRRQR